MANRIIETTVDGTTQVIETPATLTLNVSGGGGGGNSFTTIAVSGQSDIVADSSSDTLTFAAGSGVTITTNASTDTVTIAASGGGGVSDGDKGDLTISGSGTVYTIDSGVVTNAKLANVATQTFKGRTTAGTGSPEDLTVSQAKTLLGLTGTNSGDQTITLTGDVTGSGTGSFAATIANDAVTYAKMQNASVGNVVLGRAAATSGDYSEVAIGTSQLMGRGATGDLAAITLGTNLSMSGTTLNAAGSGGVADGDKGDITVSASGATWTIDSAAVSYAKIQNVSATNRILGRQTAGAGTIEELTAGTGVITFLGTPSSANLAAAITDETGSGSLVFATSPTLVTPVLGTPTSGTLTNCTGLPVSTGVSGLGTGVATFLATPSSANLAAALTDETGSGANVFATSPTLVTPLLGTPTSGTLTNCTGLPISTGVSGLGTGVATFLATPSSANLAAALTDETGTGANVFATSPTLVTPILGTPTSGTLTNCTGLPTAGVTSTSADVVMARAAGTAGAYGEVALASSQLLGKGSTGNVAAITLGTNLSMSGTTLNATGGGGVSDGDKGDITVSASGATWTIDNDVVTYAKMQNVSATDKLLGRSTAGAGDVEEIACTAAGRALIDDASASAQRTTLGVGTGDTPQFAAVSIAGNVSLESPSANIASVKSGSNVCALRIYRSNTQYIDISYTTGKYQYVHDTDVQLYTPGGFEIRGDYDISLRTSAANQAVYCHDGTNGVPVTAQCFRKNSNNIVSDTGTALTLTNSHNGKTIVCTNASSIAVTINTGLTAGFCCNIIQGGAGAVWVNNGTATKQSRGSLYSTNGQYAMIEVRYVATDTYNISGDRA